MYIESFYVLRFRVGVYFILLCKVLYVVIDVFFFICCSLSLAAFYFLVIGHPFHLKKDLDTAKFFWVGLLDAMVKVEHTKQG